MLIPLMGLLNFPWDLQSGKVTKSVSKLQPFSCIDAVLESNDWSKVLWKDRNINFVSAQLN